MRLEDSTEPLHHERPVAGERSHLLHVIDEVEKRMEGGGDEGEPSALIAIVEPDEEGPRRRGQRQRCRTGDALEG